MVKSLFVTVRSVCLVFRLLCQIITDDILAGRCVCRLVQLFLLSANFLSRRWFSQRGVGSALVSAQRSANAAQREDSGDILGICSPPETCDAFVPEAFKDNRSS